MHSIRQDHASLEAFGHVLPREVDGTRANSGDLRAPRTEHGDSSRFAVSDNIKVEPFRQRTGGLVPRIRSARQVVDRAQPTLRDEDSSKQRTLCFVAGRRDRFQIAHDLGNRIPFVIVRQREVAEELRLRTFRAEINQLLEQGAIPSRPYGREVRHC